MGSSAMKNGAKLILGLFRPSNYYAHPLDPSKSKPKDKQYGDALYSKVPLSVYDGLLECWVLKNVLGTSDKAILLEIDPPTGNVRTYPIPGTPH